MLLSYIALSLAVCCNSPALPESANNQLLAKYERIQDRRHKPGSAKVANTSSKAFVQGGKQRRRTRAHNGHGDNSEGQALQPAVDVASSTVDDTLDKGAPAKRVRLSSDQRLIAAHSIPKA